MRIIASASSGRKEKKIMFGKLIKALAGNKALVRKGAAAAQRGKPGVAAKIFAQAGHNAKKQKRGGK